jgi:hypothetical protein
VSDVAYFPDRGRIVIVAGLMPHPKRRSAVYILKRHHSGGQVLGIATSLYQLARLLSYWDYSHMPVYWEDGVSYAKRPRAPWMRSGSIIKRRRKKKRHLTLVPSSPEGA